MCGLLAKKAFYPFYQDSNKGNKSSSLSAGNKASLSAACQERHKARRDRAQRRANSGQRYHFLYQKLGVDRRIKDKILKNLF